MVVEQKKRNQEGGGGGTCQEKERLGEVKKQLAEMVPGRSTRGVWMDHRHGDYNQPLG